MKKSLKESTKKTTEESFYWSNFSYKIDFDDKILQNHRKIMKKSLKILKKSLKILKNPWKSLKILTSFKFTKLQISCWFIFQDIWFN